jgi:hypothetical protein
MSKLPASMFWDRAMRIIECVMAGLFLMLAIHLSFNQQRWIPGIGLAAGAVILACPWWKAPIKIPLMLIMMVIAEVAFNPR